MQLEPVSSPEIIDRSNEAAIEIHGIKFFNNRTSCISHFEKAHWTEKAISLIKSFGTFLIYMLKRACMMLRRVEAQMNPFTGSKANGFSKKTLVVCIHGLHDDPSGFEELVSEMRTKDLTEIDIFIPSVLKRGNAKLDDMTKPVFEEIAKWVNTPGDKELVLVGVSNGARIARAVEVEIAKSGMGANIKNLRIISIVGAGKGCTLVNLAHKLHLTWVLSRPIAEEMPTDSNRMQQLNKDWMDALTASPGPTRNYTYIASPHDWIVPNEDSTLMDVDNQDARYAFIHGHGHASGTTAASKTVAEIITNPPFDTCQAGA